MIGLLLKLARMHPPRPRPRFWRYVSPRRRGMGVLLLLLLVSIPSVYWRLTNDARIRTQASAYLASLTGGRSDVGEAKFSLFGGIYLRNVRLFVPGEDQPLFVAQSVVLRHRPWSLLMGGRLEVSEISCIEPVVNLTYDVASQTYLEAQLFQRSHQQQMPSAPPGALPQLVVRNGRVLLAEQLEGLRIHRKAYNMNISGFPVGQSDYQITLEEQQGGTLASMRMDVITGKIQLLGGSMIDMAGLDRTLLQQYGELKDRYHISGPIAVEGTWEPATGEGVLVATLRRISLRLPPDEGGLELHEVEGAIRLDKNGILLENVSGRINGQGRGQFSVSGMYRGYEDQSAYELRVAFKDLLLPMEQIRGRPAEILGELNKVVQVEGVLDGEVFASRSQGGRMVYRGQVQPRSVKAVASAFPYPLEDVRGSITFDNTLTKVDLRGARRGSQVDVAAEVYPGDGAFDVRVVGMNVPLDDQLAAALPEGVRMHYMALGPEGVGNTKVYVHAESSSAQPDVEVDIDLDGGASLEYDGFPYRVENVFAQAHIDRDHTVIKFIEASFDGRKLTMDGSISWKSGGVDEVDLTLKGRVPLDSRLADALGAVGQQAFQRFELSGWADYISGVIRKKSGGPLKHEVVAHVENVTFNDKQFPYKVENAAGVLVFDSSGMTIKALSGRHDNAKIILAGRFDYAADGSPVELQIEAQDVQFGPDVLAAIKSGDAPIADEVSVLGPADVSLHYKQAAQAPADYSCIINARGMEITHKHFPYVLRDVRGTINITPGNVALENLVSHGPSGDIYVGGYIRQGQSSSQAELSVQAAHLAIDAGLISCLDAISLPARNLVEQGGKCSIALPSISVTKPRADGAAPTWRLQGRIDLDQARLRLGQTTKQVSGSIDGVIS
ncbi:MAG: hypothetical protein GXY38_09215, partial [Planctomycetes bacterium]|nr:hypothetical protein [Planctomycetota bacterium]